MEWQDKYSVALLCGITDSNQDKYQDTRITITPLFTIDPSQMTISHPFSQAMVDGITQLRQQMRIASGLPPTAGVGLYLWLEPILLSKNSDLSQIKCLADVERFGGVILRREHPDLF